MKIKVTECSYDEVLKIAPYKNAIPKKQSAFFRWLMKTLSKGELKATDFTYTTENMETIGKDEPCLFLMNHSSFTDLNIAATLLADRQYHIVMTNDGFVGKEKLMRSLGCIEARKFITDMPLVKTMKLAVENLNSSILMYPEASYSFDGSETPLPDSLGKFVRLLNIPVVMIKVQGSFLRDPLYNNLQKRKVKTSAVMKCIIPKADIASLSVKQINELLAEEFHFDYFREQKAKNIRVCEDFRADYLHRALYKCPFCKSEGRMLGKGIYIECGSCKSKVELTEYGSLKAANDATKELPFEYVTDWYQWERECVKEEIETGTYNMELDVDIMMLVDLKSIYKVGSGHLKHDNSGFVLEGCDSKLRYTQKPNACYSLYADYYWYELGDMISIGDGRYQYYCIPKNQEKAIVAKARLATEELYKKS